MKTILGLLWLVLLLSITSPANCSTCTSQVFTNSNLYSNCADLPTLNTYLHWTYCPSNYSLSIAFIASPSKPGGWIAWAINPTATGMVGAQTLVAFKRPDGCMIVKTFNINSYNCTVESKLQFDVWDMSAEISVDGFIILFATLKLSVEIDVVNQVWQVGPTVFDGVPTMHDLGTQNLESRGTLRITAEATFGPYKPPQCQLPACGDKTKTKTATIRFWILLGLSIITTSLITLFGFLYWKKKPVKKPKPPQPPPEKKKIEKQIVGEVRDVKVDQALVVIGDKIEDGIHIHATPNIRPFPLHPNMHCPLQQHLQPACACGCGEHHEGNGNCCVM